MAEGVAPGIGAGQATPAADKLGLLTRASGPEQPCQVQPGVGPVLDREVGQ